MASYLYEIIDDLCNYDINSEEKNRLYAIELINLREWVEECLNDIPDGYFKRAFIRDFFAPDSDEPYKLWRYIQNNCFPDPDSDSDSDSELAE